MPSKEDEPQRVAGGRRVLLFLAVACLTTLGVLGPAAAAAAAPPVRETLSVELSGPHFLSGFCGMPIFQDGTLHVSSTEFDNGRVIEHIRVDLELTAGGKVVFERPGVHRGDRPGGRDRDPDGDPGQHPCAR